MSSIPERVARGAAYLDEHDPDWWRPDVPNAIDLATLDLGDGESCVLGQRCPLADPFWTRYGQQVRAIVKGGDQVASDVLEAWAAECGFTTSPWALVNHWSKLTAEWRRVIEQRRAEA